MHISLHPLKKVSLKCWQDASFAISSTSQLTKFARAKQRGERNEIICGSVSDSTNNYNEQNVFTFRDPELVTKYNSVNPFLSTRPGSPNCDKS